MKILISKDTENDFTCLVNRLHDLLEQFESYIEVSGDYTGEMTRAMEKFKSFNIEVLEKLDCSNFAEEYRTYCGGILEVEIDTDSLLIVSKKEA